MKNEYIQKVILLTGGLLLLSCASARHVGPAWYDTSVESGRGYELFMQGDFGGAIGAYVQALSLSQRFDVIEQQGLYCFNIGRVYFECDMLDSAQFFLNAAYKSFNQCGRLADAGRAAGFLALVKCRQGLPDSAWAWYKTGVPDKKSQEEKAFWLTVYGRIIWKEKRDAGVQAYFEEAFTCSKSLNRRHAMAMLDYDRACVYAYGGDYTEAQRLLLEGLAFSEKAPERYDRYKLLLKLAALCACRNAMDEAAQYYLRAGNTRPQSVAIPDFESLKSCPKEFPGE